VVMTPRVIPGMTKPGPYCEVVFPVSHPKPRCWVRVIEGDERNGRGVVFMPPLVSGARIERGLKVRFAGGTAFTPAKVVEPSAVELTSVQQ
jgi:hypothetical protein